MTLPAGIFPNTIKTIVPVSSARRAHLWQNILIQAQERGIAARKSDQQHEGPRPHTGDNFPAKRTTPICAECKGWCCRSGGNRAYIGADDLVRIFALDASPQQIADAYVRHIPEKIYKDSCIYHSETGCGLPRAMRSEVCLGFVCLPLIQHFQKEKRDARIPAKKVSAR